MICLLTKPSDCQFFLDIAKAKNEFEWITYLVDVEYLVENKIELIGEPD
jgi:hypothetical protein